MTASDIAEERGKRPRGKLRSLLLPDRASRMLALWVLATTLGTGMVAAGGVVYLVQVVGISGQQVGLGLAISGFVGLGMGIPVGHLADRLSSRTVCIATLLLRAVGMLTFLGIHSFPAFLAAITLVTCADVGGNAAGGALIAGIGGSDRVRLRSYLHSVSNLGLAGGALLAGVAVASGTPAAFRAMIVATAVAPMAAALLLLGVPVVPAAPVRVASRPWQSLRDRTYLTVTVLHAVLSMHIEVLSFGVPLWLLRSGAAPTWLISVLLVIKTVTVVLFQVPASKGVTSIRSAALVGRRAGAVLLVACLVTGAAGRLHDRFAIACFVLGGALFTLGELFQSASSFGHSFDLAPDHAQGQYQGVFAMGRGLARATGPAVFSVMCVAWGFTGWMVVGLGLALAGVLLPVALRSHRE